MKFMDNFDEVRRKLLKWYFKNGRDFPWRHTYDPYKIMIAEFMLHRTKAEQVTSVYLKFLEKYPDVYSLSNALEKDIKEFTINLGLHWRYKHFINASKFIVEKFKGSFPTNYNELRQIPGIGEYISSAISIIAFNKPASVVDSNIARFFNRFYNLNLTGELRRKKIIIDKSSEFFNVRNCRNLLFAMIDFCSIICKPQNPRCDFCLLNKSCEFKNNKKS
jgi:A/G-specific adenine glycosylase